MKNAFKLAEVFNPLHYWKRSDYGIDSQSLSCHELLPTPSLPNKGGGKELHSNVNKSLAAWLPSCLAAFTFAEKPFQFPVILNLVQDLDETLKHRGQSDVQGDVRRKLGKLCAFTLAEVLITLGIIGVVAAITMPTLIQNHRKHVIETRLQKFYSTINQAIKLSEVDNGNAKDWDKIEHVTIYDDSGNSLYNEATNAMDWYNKYLAKYLKVLKIEQNSNYEKSITLYFPDGSLGHIATTWIFYPYAKDFVLAEKDGLIDRDRSLSGKKYFTFYLSPTCQNGQLTPYGMCSSVYNNENAIRNNSEIGCREVVNNERALCTLLIMRNGWKIPDDYPIRF